jgi:hypothetical protein
LTADRSWSRAVATQWLERYRQIWEGNFKRLDALLDQMKIKEKKRGG